jgi:PAS domain S-box-containing protein
MKKPKASSTPENLQPEIPVETPHNSPADPQGIRRRAEAALQGRPDQAADLTGEDVRRLIYELQIHQIELEMQNEALRQTQVDLETARDRYWDLFELAPVGYLMLSKQGVILEANQAAAKLLEIDRGRLLQTALTAYIVREDQDIFYLGAQRARQENHTQEFELRLVTAAGKPVEVSLQCTRVEEQGQLTGQIRVTLSDISERKEQARTLQAYAERIETSNRDLEAFAHVVSHDLKEPLNKIKGFGNILLRNYTTQLDEQGRGYLERMHQAANRMEKLIEALLALSRLSNQKPRFQAVDLNEIVQCVLADLEIRLQETGGQVTLGPLPSLMAEPTQMQQLFANLIGNALKFRHPGVSPQVQVTASPTAAGQVEFQVRDNGIGFEPEAVARLFNPFVRLHGKNAYEGTGIGLVICRKIVENHAGTITATSAVGQGATFIVTLPLQPPGGPETGE